MSSPNDTVVTAGSNAAILDAYGNRWTITAGRQVAVNGVPDQTTANVIELAYVNGEVWQENTQLRWWYKTVPTDTWGPFNGTPVSPLPSGVFSVSAGHILAPNGSEWQGYGVDVYHADAQVYGAGLAATLESEFPGINLVRIAGQVGDTPASYAPFINAMTKDGAAVVIEDHLDTPTVLTGSALTNESNWYAGMARYYAGNPDVMFATMNEPAAGDIGQMQATYNALRGAGDKGTIFLEAGEGAAGIAGTLGSGASATVGSMTNVAWDLHAYDWQSGYSANVATIQGDQDSRIATYQAIKSASGTMPVVSLETGQATNGLQVDRGGYQEIQATYTNPLLEGASAWAWDNWGTPGLVNSLTYAGGNYLTSYGHEVAGYIAAHR